MALAQIETLPDGQKPVAYALAIAMLLVSLELVRRRKLREEYAALWIGTGVLLFLLAWQHRWLSWFQDLIAAKSPVSALFFGAFVFLMLLCLQFSVRLSKMSFRQKTLAQRLTQLEKALEDANRSNGDG